ncbi:hypothetical protein [Micromonospora sp. DT47]|uniref:hypothetical protein n=1 Tax=Micromonospora sp. DT47 TaxID=3393431 RepID=UPI003CEB1C81
MLDVLTIGRVGVDIYPLQIGTPLAEVETFGKFLGVPVAAPAAFVLHPALLARTGSHRLTVAFPPSPDCP